MLDHAHVHSCFGILSSFVLWISSFTQAQPLFRTRPEPNRTHPDPSGPEKDPTGPLLDPERTLFYPCRQHPYPIITHSQADSYASHPKTSDLKNISLPFRHPRHSDALQRYHGEIWGALRGRFSRLLTRTRSSKPNCHQPLAPIHPRHPTLTQLFLRFPPPAQLSTIDYPLPTIHYPLPTTHYPLPLQPPPFST